jgi:hypothetical protein
MSIMKRAHVIVVMNDGELFHHDIVTASQRLGWLPNEIARYGQAAHKHRRDRIAKCVVIEGIDVYEYGSTTPSEALEVLGL